MVVGGLRTIRVVNSGQMSFVTDAGVDFAARVDVAAEDLKAGFFGDFITRWSGVAPSIVTGRA